MIVVFRIAAIAEAVTWLGLLIGMYGRHIQGDENQVVWMFGTLHGYMCLFYVLTVFLARASFGWTTKATIVGLLASVPPFATLAFERWAVRSARAAATREPAGAEP